jgi:hypothetical protein
MQDSFLTDGPIYTWVLGGFTGRGTHDTALRAEDRASNENKGGGAECSM